MSAPDTNIEKQQRRHAGPLTGMTVAVVFAGLLLVGLIGWTVYNAGVPEGSETQIDGRTGAAVERVEGAVTTD